MAYNATVYWLDADNDVMGTFVADVVTEDGVCILQRLALPPAYIR